VITAIIVNRDGEATLGRCLESLDGPGIEVVLVDNASEDGSLSLVRERFPKVTVLPQKSNLGFAAANNLAAEKASGEALLLLNNDAWLETGALELLANRLRGRSDVGLAAPRLEYPDGGPQFAWSPVRGVFGEVIQILRNPFESHPWAHGTLMRATARLLGPLWYTAACVLVRSEAWRSVGGFDERFFMYFEDVDLCIRLGNAPTGRGGSTTSIDRRSCATIGSIGRRGKRGSSKAGCVGDSETLRWIVGLRVKECDDNGAGRRRPVRNSRGRRCRPAWAHAAFEAFASAGPGRVGGGGCDGGRPPRDRNR
jgi:glycosyltransferase involved in cell wall biosynthesis